MKTHRSIESFQLENPVRPVITFGTFDGVHLGHKYIFSQLRELADEIGGETVVTSFHPHPRKIVYPDDKSLKLLTSIDEKVDLLRPMEINHLIIIPFSIEFSRMSPAEYIENFILQYYKPHTIVIGYDHRFGHNRTGNINTLKAHASGGKYDVIEIEQKQIDSMKISSTQIREALLHGDIRRANKLLGYRYRLGGEVIHGEKIGGKLGYKTANIKVHDSDKLIPAEGIYAVFVWYNEKRYKGMLYIGKRPTIRDNGELSIEVHLFDFDERLYDREIVVEFVDFIRKDATFDNLEELTAHIAADKQNSLKILENVGADEYK